MDTFFYYFHLIISMLLYTLIKNSILFFNEITDKSNKSILRSTIIAFYLTIANYVIT